MVGHAVECRINAEDPARDFAPTPGTLDTYRAPGGPWVRLDSHCHTGAVISPHYGSLVAKLICGGPDRDTALDRTRHALREFELAGKGVSSTIGFHQELIDHPLFRSGEPTAGFLRQHMLRP